MAQATQSKFYQHRFTFHGRKSHEPRLVWGFWMSPRDMEAWLHVCSRCGGGGTGTMLISAKSAVTSNLTHHHKTCPPILQIKQVPSPTPHIPPRKHTYSSKAIPPLGKAPLKWCWPSWNPAWLLSHPISVKQELASGPTPSFLSPFQTFRRPKSGICVSFYSKEGGRFRVFTRFCNKNFLVCILQVNC